MSMKKSFPMGEYMGKSMWQKNQIFIRIWSKFCQCLMSKLLWNLFKAKIWFKNLICFRVSSLKESLSNNVTKFSFVPSFITFAKGELNNNYPSTAKDMTKDEFNQILLKFLKDTEGEFLLSALGTKEIVLRGAPPPSVGRNIKEYIPYFLI